MWKKEMGKSTEEHDSFPLLPVSYPTEEREIDSIPKETFATEPEAKYLDNLAGPHAPWPPPLKPTTLAAS